MWSAHTRKSTRESSSQHFSTGDSRQAFEWGEAYPPCTVFREATTDDRTDQTTQSINDAHQGIVFSALSQRNHVRDNDLYHSHEPASTSSLNCPSDQHQRKVLADAAEYSSKSEDSTRE